MPRNLILYLTIALCLSSCVSKKYGRFFNNRSTSPITFEGKASPHDSSLVVSIKNEPYLSIRERGEEFDSQYNANSETSQNDNISNETHITLISGTAVMPRGSTETIKVEKNKQDYRQQEPTGVFGLILTVVGVLGLFILPALSFMAIIGGGVLGIVSLNKIRKKKEKWKGKGLGIAAIILSGITVTFTLSAFGILIYLASTGQLS